MVQAAVPRTTTFLKELGLVKVVYNPMTTLQNQVIEELAITLQDSLEAPTWSQFVKTGHGKERPPQREDWWFVRGAAILKSVDNLGPIGVNKLRRKYGTKKNRGYKPEKSTTASGKIIRTLLQQLEEAGFVEHGQKGNHKGRMLTSEGRSIITDATNAARDKVEA